MFYSQNTFRHARTLEAPTASETILVCTDWLRMLSARLPQLEDVVISIQLQLNYWSWSPVHHENVIPERFIDVLPIMLMVWKHEMAGTKLIVPSLQQISIKAMQGPLTATEPTAALDNLVFDLGAKNMLDLRRSQLLLRHIYVCHDTNTGSVHYRSTNPSKDFIREAIVPDDTSKPTWCPLVGSALFHELPRPVLDHIFGLTLAPREITFDLVSKATTG